MKLSRFVHLSDIHFGQEDSGGHVVIQKDARDELESDCERLAKSIGKAHGIIVTGDISFKGTIDEFIEASDFLDRLCEIVGCPTDNVLVVPGNHDIDWTKIDWIGETAVKEIRSCQLSDLESVLAKIQKSQLHPLRPKFEAYEEFARVYDCCYESLCKPFWIKDFEVGDNHKLRFVGLNTVIASSFNDKERDLILGATQYVVERVENTEYVMLMHHPRHWLRDESEFEDYINSRVRIVICGHEHKSRVQEHKHDGRFCQLAIFSGATNPPKTEYPFGFKYNWLEFFTAEDGELVNLCVRVFPRHFNRSTTRFEVDPSRLSLGVDGEVVFRIPSEQFRVGIRNSTGDLCLESSEPNEEMSKEIEMPGRGDELEVLNVSGEDRRFKRLQFFYWKHLSALERIKILAKLDVLNDSGKFQRLPQDVELKFLEKARGQRKLNQLWSEVMKFVSGDRQEENPFEEGE